MIISGISGWYRDENHLIVQWKENFCNVIIYTMGLIYATTKFQLWSIRFRVQHIIQLIIIYNLSYHDNSLFEKHQKIIGDSFKTGLCGMHSILYTNLFVVCAVGCRGCCFRQGRGTEPRCQWQSIVLRILSRLLVLLIFFRSSYSNWRNLQNIQPTSLKSYSPFISSCKIFCSSSLVCWNIFSIWCEPLLFYDDNFICSFHFIAYFHWGLVSHCLFPSHATIHIDCEIG